MDNKTSLLVFLIVAVLTPTLLQGRPQMKLDLGCNATSEALFEERTGRPDYPDPEHKPAEKELHGRVIFPGPMMSSKFPDRKSQNFLPKVPITERGPSCAEGSTFCEDTDGYPKNYISSLLRSENKMFQEFFGQDVVTFLNVSQRIDASDESPLCPSLEQVVYPKTAQNKDDKWLYIINQDQFIQGIRVEKCIKEAPCALSESLPIGYKTTCRQKYIYRKLVSLNGEGKAFTDSFRIPSCCACHFRAVSIASRFGMSEMGISPARSGAKVSPPSSSTSAPPNWRRPKQT